MTQTEITNTIKAKRKSLGLSQQELAEAVGLKQQSYQRIESGSSSPTLNTLQPILQALGLSISIVDSN